MTIKVFIFLRECGVVLLSYVFSISYALFFGALGLQTVLLVFDFRLRQREFLVETHCLIFRYDRLDRFYFSRSLLEVPSKRVLIGFGGSRFLSFCLTVLGLILIILLGSVALA